jgi:hypothetical protein
MKLQGTPLNQSTHEGVTVIAWLLRLFDVLFGCSHRRTSFPLTPLRRSPLVTDGLVRKTTYVVCLDCGKEFDYDWKEMRLGNALSAGVYHGNINPIPVNR